jgi:hypothetical protein
MELSTTMYGTSVLVRGIHRGDGGIGWVVIGFAGLIVASGITAAGLDEWLRTTPL